MDDRMVVDELVERAKEGDEAAFGAIYDAFADRLYRYVLFRVRDHADAEDLVQRIFMKMIEALPRYEQRGIPFGAWVFSLARNAVIDHGRSRRDHLPLEAIAASSPESSDPHRLAERSLDRAVLLEALDALSADQREVIVYRFFAGLSPQEIARLLGKREGAVRALQFRALGSLRARLGAGVALPAPATPEGVDR